MNEAVALQKEPTTAIIPQQSPRLAALWKRGTDFLGCELAILGGAMTYVAGALKDANIGLEKVFQFCAGGVVVAVLLLLFVKPKKELDYA